MQPVPVFLRRCEMIQIKLIIQIVLSDVIPMQRIIELFKQIIFVVRELSHQFLLPPRSTCL